MTYLPCRWYDACEELQFTLKLLQMLPQRLQIFVGERLTTFLDNRGVACLTQELPSERCRWYDRVESLAESLARLKSSPESLHRQTAQFLTSLMAQLKFVA